MMIFTIGENAGWLAREGKIYCRAVDEELWFSNSLSDGFITFG